MTDLATQGELTTAERPKLPFMQLVMLLEDAEKALTAEVDPATLGELVREKIDAIREVDSKLEAEIARLDQDIEALKARKHAVQNGKERLRSLVKQGMEYGGFDLMSGNTWAVRLQNNPAKLIIDHEPTESDYRTYKDFCEATLVYTWKKDVIKERLKAGDHFGWAKLETGRHVRFVPKKGK